MTAQDAVVVESTGGASTRSRQALVVALVVAALALAIDQGSKVLAAAQLTQGERIPLVGDLFVGNVADVFVVAGVGLVCLNLLTQTPRTGFGGSPTILVDGIDLFPTTLVHSLVCRVYVTENGFAGTPTATQIGEALRDRMQGGESDR